MHGAEVEKSWIAGGAGRCLFEDIIQAIWAKIEGREGKRVARIIEAVLP